MSSQSRTTISINLAFGNNGTWQGGYWRMDADNDAEAGDPSEANGSTAYYKIPKSVILPVSGKTLIGFCPELPGCPEKCRVQYSGKLVTDYDPESKYSADTVFRIEKTDNFVWGTGESETMNNW